MCVLTWIPAPRSPSLGNGSLSIIRTGIPFFRNDRARTRPEGPAPTYKYCHLERVSRILLYCKAYNHNWPHVCRNARMWGMSNLDFSERDSESRLIIWTFRVRSSDLHHDSDASSLPKILLRPDAYRLNVLSRSIN